MSAAAIEWNNTRPGEEEIEFAQMNGREREKEKESAPFAHFSANHVGAFASFSCAFSIILTSEPRFHYIFCRIFMCVSHTGGRFNAVKKPSETTSEDEKTIIWRKKGWNKKENDREKSNLFKFNRIGFFAPFIGFSKRLRNVHFIVTSIVTGHF